MRDQLDPDPKSALLLSEHAADQIAADDGIDAIVKLDGRCFPTAELLR